MGEPWLLARGLRLRHELLRLRCRQQGRGRSRQEYGFIETHDAYTLGVSTDDADIVGRNALDLASGCHHDQLVVVVDSYGADDWTIAFAGLDVDDSFAAPALGAVLGR